MFFTTFLLWWVWLHMASCPPSFSSMGEEAGFDVQKHRQEEYFNTVCFRV